MKIFFLFFLLSCTPFLFCDNDFNWYANQDNPKCSVYFKKNNGVLNVFLKNGKKLTFTDKIGNEITSYLTDIKYFIKDCWDLHDMLILDYAIEEYFYCQLIDLNTGNLIALDGYPILSPDQQHFLTFLKDLELQANDNIVSVYSIKNSKIQKVFSENFGENCGPEKISWSSNSEIHITMECNTFSLSQNIFNLTLSENNESWNWSQ